MDDEARRGEAAVDEVFLEGLRFYAYHGVNPEEKAQGQRFTVDVALRTDLRGRARAMTSPRPSPTAPSTSASRRSSRGSRAT
jgi:hypothetical protein